MIGKMSSKFNDSSHKEVKQDHCVLCTDYREYWWSDYHHVSPLSISTSKLGSSYRISLTGKTIYFDISLWIGLELLDKR